MKYKIENVEQFKEDLVSIREKIDMILKLDTSEKELTDESIEKIVELKKQILEYTRKNWGVNPKIKIVSSAGTELTVY